MDKILSQEEDIAKTLEFIDSINNPVCGGTQPRFLFNLSSNLQGKGEIVEIGTYVGKSLIALALAQKLKRDGKKVFSIDIREHENIKQNLRKAGLEDWITLVAGHSSKVVKKWNRPIELLWIDADHSYIGTKFAIKRWSNFVIDGGYIAFHDYGPECIGVVKAVQDYILSRYSMWRVVSDREAGSIFVAQKIKKIIEKPRDNSIIDNIKSFFCEICYRCF